MLPQIPIAAPPTQVIAEIGIVTAVPIIFAVAAVEAASAFDESETDIVLSNSLC